LAERGGRGKESFPRSSENELDPGKKKKKIE
jgi:hypothetical protein